MAGLKPSPITGYTLTPEHGRKGAQARQATLARRKAEAEQAAMQVFADAVLEAAGVTVATMREMDPRLRLEGARDVLNRFLGKPVQATEVRVGPVGPSFSDQVRQLTDEELDAAIAEQERLLAIEGNATDVTPAS